MVCLNSQYNAIIDYSYHDEEHDFNQPGAQTLNSFNAGDTAVQRM